MQIWCLSRFGARSNSGLLKTFNTFIRTEWQRQEEELGHQVKALTRKLIKLPVGIRLNASRKRNLVIWTNRNEETDFVSSLDNSNKNEREWKMGGKSAELKIPTGGRGMSWKPCTEQWFWSWPNKEQTHGRFVCFRRDCGITKWVQQEKGLRSLS